MDNKKNKGLGLMKRFLRMHDRITGLFGKRIRLEVFSIGLCLIFSNFSLSITLTQAAEIPKNWGQAQQAFENIRAHTNSALAEEKPSKPSEINIIDETEVAELKGPRSRMAIDDDGTPGYYWRNKDKFDLGIFKSELSVFRKEAPVPEIFPFFFDRTQDEDESQRELKVVKLTQKSKGYCIETQYSYGGKDLKNPDKYMKPSYTNSELKNDEEKIQIWGTKKIGPVGLKTYISRSWNNVEKDPDKYRMAKTFGGGALDFKVPRLPFWFNLSYSQGTSESTMAPDGSKTKGENEQNYGGSLYFYGDETYDITLSSSHSPTRDRIRSHRKTDTFWHEISANIRPTSYITITPTISLGEYRYRWYGEKTENPSASLSVYLSQLFKTVDLYLWGYYSGMRGTDGYQNDMTLNTSIGISWTAKYFSSIPEMKFAIELDNATYVDKIYLDNSSNTVGTSFSVKFMF
jgi:hypothetical protein